MKKLWLLKESEVWKLQALTLILALVLGIITVLVDISPEAREKCGILFQSLTLGVSTSVYLKNAWLSQLVQMRFEDDRVSSMHKRSFEVTFGLWSGYSEAHGASTLEDAQRCVGEWMEQQVVNELPVLSGFLQSSVMIYPLRNAKNLNENEPMRVAREPSVVYRGELSPKYDASRTDEEVVATLKSLAKFVGQGLNQRRVYFSFLERQYTIDID